MVMFTIRFSLEHLGRFPTFLYLLSLGSLLLGGHPDTVVAAEEKAARMQGQLDVTVIHVDKLGVYVPDLVFYWDSSLNKQKVAALTAAAERLRNRRATITYSALGSPTQDKRPLVVDIVPSKEPTERLGYGVISPEHSGSNGYNEEDEARSASSKEAFSSEPFPERDIHEAMDSHGDAADEETVQTSLDSSSQSAQASRSALPIQKRDVLMLVEHVLHLTEKKSLDSILYYYADSVDYYARGEVKKDYIRRDLGYYFRNWDTIHCALEGDIQLHDTPRPDVKSVRFESTYAVENTKKSVSGRTENTWLVQRTHTGLKVIDQKQKVIHGNSGENP